MWIITPQVIIALDFFFVCDTNEKYMEKKPKIKSLCQMLDDWFYWNPFYDYKIIALKNSYLIWMGSDAVIYYFLIDFWLMCTNILLHDLL